MRPAAFEIDDDDRAARAGIGDEGGIAVGMEAHVVQVAALQRHVLAEVDDLRHLVGRQLDAHELGAAGDHLLVAGRGRIEHPEIAAIVGHHRLHAHEVIACRARRGFRVAPGIPLLVGVRFQRAVAADFHHRDRAILRPAREIDEEAAIRRDRHAGRLAGEACRFLEPERPRLGGRRRRGWRQGLRLGTHPAGGQRRQRQTAGKHVSTVDHRPFPVKTVRSQATRLRFAGCRRRSDHARRASLPLRG